jgi:hypothetical protein
MSPGHPFIKKLATIPVTPTVPAHSIIAVADESPLDRAGDGVVKYESAHVDGVASELIVRSPHSGMQDAPQSIEEVRRILLEHSAKSACSMPILAGGLRRGLRSAIPAAVAIELAARSFDGVKQVLASSGSLRRASNIMKPVVRDVRRSG